MESSGRRLHLSTIQEQVAVALVALLTGFLIGEFTRGSEAGGTVLLALSVAAALVVGTVQQTIP